MSEAEGEAKIAHKAKTEKKDKDGKTQDNPRKSANRDNGKMRYPRSTTRQWEAVADSVVLYV